MQGAQAFPSSTLRGDMTLVILTSTTAVAPGGVAEPDLVTALKTLAGQDDTHVCVVSVHAQPSWFETAFSDNDTDDDNKVHFLRWASRQNGAGIQDLSRRNDIPCRDFIVFAATKDDISMAKNGKASVVSKCWGGPNYASKYAIGVDNSAGLVEVIRLMQGWPGQWYYEESEPWYSVRSLVDLSSKYKSSDQVNWARRIKSVIKQGGSRLVSLQVICNRSLWISPDIVQKKSMWGLYPSSKSKNDDSEMLSELVHRLRTGASQMHMAREGSPLFIRHTPSRKRSLGGSGNRNDPSEQVESLHLNPAYEGKIKDRNVIVFDDCTTYGVSFGVAAALLRRAGAASVSCIALGKFGHCLNYYEIEIEQSVFEPIKEGNYSIIEQRPFSRETNDISQATVLDLILVD